MKEELQPIFLPQTQDAILNVVLQLEDIANTHFKRLQYVCVLYVNSFTSSNLSYVIKKMIKDLAT